MVQPRAEPALKLAALATRLTRVERQLAATQAALDDAKMIGQRVTNIERRLAQLERANLESRPAMPELHRLPGNVSVLFDQLHRDPDDEDTAPTVPTRRDS